MTQSSSLLSDETPLELCVLLYPGMTLLDFARPQSALGPHGNTHLLWKTLEPVRTAQGLFVLPTSTFADNRRTFDVLIVPGGMGTADALKDDEILDFLAEAGKTARYVTSVCTGSFLLAAAGLLDGYKAAMRYAFYDALAATAADLAHASVVADCNRLTGGAVTANRRAPTRRASTGGCGAKRSVPAARRRPRRSVSSVGEPLGKAIEVDPSWNLKEDLEQIMRLIKAEAENDRDLADTKVIETKVDGGPFLVFERGPAVVRLFAAGSKIYIGLGETSKPVPLSPERDSGDYDVNTVVEQIISELRQPTAPGDL
jgi:putative intracellular protease/amidase